MELTARDLARLMELNKKKAELEFQRDIMGVDTEDELKAVSENAGEISSKARVIGIEIAVPNQRSLEDLGKSVKSFPPDAIREGLKIRDGKAFQVLKDRGVIIKKNYENRFEIAKLAVMLAKMSAAERNVLAQAVFVGTIESPVKVSSLGEEERKKLAKFVRHCGICCTIAGDELVPVEEPPEKETKIEVSNRLIWITEQSKAQLEEAMKKIKELNTQIQLQNAVRQIKNFSEQEEAEFADLQKRYLELLKERDGLLKESDDEEKLSVKN